MTKGPIRLAQLVARLVETTTDPEGSSESRGAAGRRTFEVFRAFEGIGPPLTDHAEPSSFRKGRLTLRVRSSAWLTELAMMQSQLVGRLNRALRRPYVEEVRLVLGSPRPRPKPSPPSPVRLSPRQREQVEAWSSSLSNEQVRAAFERAAARSLARGPSDRSPFSGPPGPRVMPAIPLTLREDGPEDDEPDLPPELTYGFGDRWIDRWKLPRRGSGEVEPPDASE